MTTRVLTGKFILKGEKSNTTSISANTNIFEKNIETSSDPAAVFLIYAVFQAVGKLKAIRTLADGQELTTKPEILTPDLDMAANGLYMLSIVLTKGEQFNLQYTVNSAITKLIVLEDIT